MTQQPQQRIDELIEKYPALAEIRDGWKWRTINDQERLPELIIRIEKPDPDHLLRKFSNLYRDGHSYVLHRNESFRGTRQQYVVAVDIDGDIIDSRGRVAVEELQGPVKKIFQVNPGKSARTGDVKAEMHPDRVKYLCLVTALEWFMPHTDPRQRCLPGGNFKIQAGCELDILVLPKRKDQSWKDILHLAELQEKFYQAADELGYAIPSQNRKQILENLIERVIKREHSR